MEPSSSEQTAPAAVNAGELGLLRSNLSVQLEQQPAAAAVPSKEKQRSSTLQYLSRSSFIPKDIPLEAFSIDNQISFDSDASLHSDDDGVSETGIVTFPSSRKAPKDPKDIVPTGMDTRALDYDKLHKLLMGLHRSATSFVNLKRHLRAIGEACRLVSEKYRVHPNVESKGARRELGIKLFLLMGVYFGLPTVLVFAFPLQFPMYTSNGTPLPPGGKVDCSMQMARKKLVVKSVGSFWCLVAALCVLAVHLSFYVLYRCFSFTRKSRTFQAGSFIFSSFLFLTFCVLLGFYLNVLEGAPAKFEMQRFTLFFFLLTITLSCLLLAARGWTGKLNFMGRITILFNVTHNFAILLGSIVTFLFYIEVTEQKRPCGWGRPLTSKTMQEVLQLFSSAMLVTVVTSFLLTREVQMFLKARRVSICKDDAYLGAMILTWSFAYPAYFSRICCRRRRIQRAFDTSRIVPTQALPSGYSNFAAVTDVTVGTAGLLERKAKEAREKAEEAEQKAEEAKKLAAEAKVLAEEVQNLAENEQIYASSNTSPRP